jgi:peptidoglycan hydrolase CwlO-like protein
MARIDVTHTRAGFRRGLALATTTLSAAALAVALPLLTDTASGQGSTVTLDGQRAHVRELEAGLLQVDGDAVAAERAYGAADTRFRTLQRRIADNGRELTTARANFALAQRRLAERLVQIYSERPPSLVEVLVSTGSLTDAVDGYDMLKRVADQDEDLLTGFDRSRKRLAEIRVQLVSDRRGAEASRRVAAQRLDQMRALAAQRRTLLASARGALSRMEAEAAQRAALQARLDALRRAQAAAASAAQPDSSPETVQAATPSAGAPQTSAGGAASAPQTASAGVGSHLQQIAQCESGGNPRAVSPSGQYRGKYQFSVSTWRAVGGSGDPAAASEAEQDMRASILYQRAGAGQWPVCGAR